MASSGGLRGLQPGKYSGVDLVKTRIHYVNATTQYVGIAPPNSKQTDKVWQIKRLTLDSASRVTAIEFARSVTDSNNIETSSGVFAWSDRTTLSYGADGD